MSFQSDDRIKREHPVPVHHEPADEAVSLASNQPDVRKIRRPDISRPDFVSWAAESGAKHADRDEGGLGERLPCSFHLMLLLFGSQLISELVLRINLDGPFFSIGLLYLTLFCLVRAVILSALLRSLPPKARTAAIYALLFIIPFVYAAQLVYYKFFRTFFVVYSIGHGGQILQFMEDIVIKVLRNTPWFVVMLSPLSIYYVFVKKRIDANCARKGKKWQEVLAALAAAFVLFGTTVGVMATDRSLNSPWEHYFLENEILSGTNQFGLLSAMGVDISHMVYPRSALVPDDLIPDPIDPPEVTETELPGASDPLATDPAIIIPHIPNILPIDYDTRLEGYVPENDSSPILMGKTRADLVRYLDLVFSRTAPSYTNDHTGRGKGFNLIFVTAESFSKYCIDEELTPTLWHMYHQGVYFENFYVPVWTVSTLDGEYAGLCGMIPKQGVWTLKEAHKNDMAMAPGRMFERLGYQTYAWHNHTWNYYARDLSHPNLGYDYRGLGHGLDVKRTWPESDLEMIEKTAFEFVDKEPFHVYYLTVSGHANWTKMGNAMATRHWDTFSHLDLHHEGIAYLAANYELELAMDSLLRQLREAGIADRTLIVINPDHYPYALEEHSSYEALAGKSLDKVFDIYESCALFYHDGIEPEVVDKYCTSLDLLPTIYNYMGVPYDSRFLSGRDIFSDSEALAIFLGRSWITEKGRYDAATGTFTLHPGQELDDQAAYIDRINREVKLRYDTARVIIDSDYYKDLLSDEEWAEINEPYLTFMKDNPWPTKTGP
ncbi:MAG TPA: sulfatase-like hydrolase/transferase [Bacillota bacterium]|jgi:lipoteichoic acid synthase|nr:sulfatase-like hydrolase/transferase [Fastidiosipila sp.]HPX93093.1 sulfatase-like hydrolase/transferase [Bacillota bacterium]HQB80834.1 sulfatase-like hydrolase/transferase [Bacillota bacterium]